MGATIALSTKSCTTAAWLRVWGVAAVVREGAVGNSLSKDNFSQTLFQSWLLLILAILTIVSKPRFSFLLWCLLLHTLQLLPCSLSFIFQKPSTLYPSISCPGDLFTDGCPPSVLILVIGSFFYYLLLGLGREG